MSFGLFFLLGSIDRRAFGAHQLRHVGDNSALQMLGVVPDLGRNMLDPDAIVLGGGVSNAARLYDGISDRLRRYVFCAKKVVHTKILKAKFGDSSGVRGAAWLTNVPAKD